MINKPRKKRAAGIISIQNITKRFGPVVAVDDVSLDIPKNEFFALLGPSGCGKTTLLRMIAGFETPTSGQILIDGENVSRVPPNKRPVNMVPIGRPWEFQTRGTFMLGWPVKFATGVKGMKA